MRRVRTIQFRLRALFDRCRVEQELEAELRDHLERQIEVHRAAGLPPADARAAALREFGNVPLVQEQCRDARRLNWIDDLRRDLGYALRSMRRTRGYAAVAVLSLAVAIGANTAVFSLLDAVVLRSLPVAAPEQLVLIEATYEAQPSIISYPMYRDLAERQQVFSDVAASHDFYAEPLRVRILGSTAVRAVRGGTASGNYFSTLGLVPALGRFFAPVDDDPNDPASVAVVSYDFWQRELGGLSSVVGHSLSINEEPFTVIGVAPAGFRGTAINSSLEVWVPLTKFRSRRDLTERRGTFFKLLGRLRRGVTVEQAQTAMTLLFQQLRAEELQAHATIASRLPARVEGYRIALQPGGKGFGFFRERLARTLTILMGMAALTVAVACLNLATLVFARMAARRREIALRQSLGASRRRLLQQLLTESVLLTVLGGALGLAFAAWASTVLLSFVSTDVALHGGFDRYVPESLRLQVDLRVLAFTAAVALLAGVLLALASAPSLDRANLVTLLEDGGRHSRGLGSLRIPARKVLVAQVGFSMVLLVGAGLMLRTLGNLRGLDAGFDPENVLVVDLDLAGTGRTGSQLVAFERHLHERLGALPGVRSASLSWIRMFGGSDWRWNVVAEGSSVAAEPVAARLDAVSAGYFETVGMRLVAGRTFTPRDDASAPPVAIVNEAFVRRLFPNHGPLGKRFSLGRTPNAAMAREIVGVVKDAKYNDLRQDTMEMFYVPLLQAPTSPARQVQTRAAGPPQALVPQVRTVLREADPNIVVTETKTLAEQVERTLVRERLLASLAGFFGAAALVLSCIGLYGVLAFHVVERTQEIGVRMALGSSPTGATWLVTRNALWLVGLGVALGVAAALALSRLLDSLLFGLTPADPVTIAGVLAIVLGVAGLSCYVPARRAAGVDPIIALRSE
jgi:predicted permease